MTEETIEVVTANSDLYAKLIVPTQSEGATFGAYSTQVSGDTLAVGNTGGSIEEDPYEDYVRRLTVSSDTIEIGLLLSKDEVGVTRQAADYRLRQLRESGHVEAEKIGNTLVWSLSE